MDIIETTCNPFDPFFVEELEAQHERKIINLQVKMRNWLDQEDPSLAEGVRLGKWWLIYNPQFLLFNLEIPKDDLIHKLKDRLIELNNKKRSL